jgi:hypothetical protein
VAGNGLWMGSGVSAEFPTDVKEVLTLLGKSPRSISNLMRASNTRGITWSFWRSNLVWKTACPRIFELTNRVGLGHVCHGARPSRAASSTGRCGRYWDVLEPGVIERAAYHSRRLRGLDEFRHVRQRGRPVLGDGHGHAFPVKTTLQNAHAGQLGREAGEGFASRRCGIDMARLQPSS